MTAKIPETLRVSVRDSKCNSDDDFPLGYVCDGGDNSQNRKTWASADNWAGNKNSIITADNTPVAGVKISKSVRRTGGWTSSGNVVWQIVDPRGWECQIQSGNFARIISESVIENGVIKADCYYAKDGGTLILVPVGTTLDLTLREEVESRANGIADNKKKFSEFKQLLKSGMVKLAPGCRVLVGNADGTTSERIYYGQFKLRFIHNATELSVEKKRKRNELVEGLVNKKWRYVALPSVYTGEKYFLLGDCSSYKHTNDVYWNATISICREHKIVEILEEQSEEIPAELLDLCHERIQKVKSNGSFSIPRYISMVIDDSDGTKKSFSTSFYKDEIKSTSGGYLDRGIQAVSYVATPLV